MLKALFRFYFKLAGWKIDGVLQPEYQRCVLVAAPHTSNWDFVIAMAAMDIMKVPLRFTIKDEILRFPLGMFIRPLGALGINRRPRQAGEERPSMTEAMIDLFKKHDLLAMIVTAEGTRSLRTEWKTGFYYVALGAQVPIALSYIDYEKKLCGIKQFVMPTGDIDADMRKIMDFYRTHGKGKHPELFSLDVRYSEL